MCPHAYGHVVCILYITYVDVVSCFGLTFDSRIFSEGVKWQNTPSDSSNSPSVGTATEAREGHDDAFCKSDRNSFQDQEKRLKKDSVSVSLSSI